MKSLARFMAEIGQTDYGVVLDQYISSLSISQKNLLRAVQRGPLEEVKTCIGGFPYFAGDARYSYLLLVAALHRKHKAITSLLIKNNCKATCFSKTQYYSTPLYYAIQQNDFNLFKQLYKSGACIYTLDANNHMPVELALLHSNPVFIDFILLKQNCEYLDPSCEAHTAVFHAACFRGNIEIIKMCVEKKFSVNSRSNFHEGMWSGATPLHFALKGKQLGNEAVDFLLKYQVNFEIQDKQGRTALHCAADSLGEKSDDVLFNKIVKTYVRSPYHAKLNLANRSGLDHFQILCGVDWDSDESDSGKLLLILKHFIETKVGDVNKANSLKKDINKTPYYAGYTALHWAARGLSLKVLELLLENGADPRRTDVRGNTPLHLLNFKKANSFKASEIILNYGAVVDLENRQRKTTLHEAFYQAKEDDKLMQLLLSKSCTNFNHTDLYGLSYLHIVSTRDLNKVKILVSNGVSVKTHIESEMGGLQGLSALHFAIMFNKVDIVEYLLANGALVNQSDTSNKIIPPLHLACTQQIKDLASMRDRDSDWTASRKDQMRVFNLLLKHRASVNAQNSSKKTVLGMIVEIPSLSRQNEYNVRSEELEKAVMDEIITRKKMMIEILISYGANVNQHGDGGRSLLHSLFDRSDMSTKIKDLAQILLEGGAHVDARDDEGVTPLHLVVMNSSSHNNGKTIFKRDSSFFDLLLGYGADVRSKSNKEDSMLHSGVRCYHPDTDREKIFHELLNNSDTDIDAQNAGGDTPLHWAIRSRKFFCIQNLLNAGADINVENVDGKSPIGLFCDWLKERIVEGTFKLEDCLHINECKIHQIIIIHIKKLTKLNYFMSFEVRVFFKELSKYTTKNLSTIDEDIEEEVIRLKSAKIDDSPSLWDILLMNSNDLDESTKTKLHAKVSSSSKYKEEFPFFFGFLKMKLRKIPSKSLDPIKSSLDYVAGESRFDQKRKTGQDQTLAKPLVKRPRFNNHKR